MEPRAAEQHLQVIRTLMERSALYRRALAPIMLFIGGVGIVAGGGGVALGIDSVGPFYAWWFGAAGVAIAGAFAIARRQAFAEGEAFWSPPTLRVTQAVAPPLAAGLVFSMALLVAAPRTALDWFVLANGAFYGCAAHAAGFFMPRAMRRFGWVFIAATATTFAVAASRGPGARVDHLLMAVLFGVVNLAYGVYLFITEPRKSTE
jgi:hypothetical protein